MKIKHDKTKAGDILVTVECDCGVGGIFTIYNEEQTHSDKKARKNPGKRLLN